MEFHLTVLHVSNPQRNTATKAPQYVAPSVAEEEIDNELQVSESDYIPAFQIVYATFEDLYHMNEAALKVHDEIKLQGLTDDTENKKFHHLFTDANEKSLTGTCTDLYQMVEQAALKTTYLRGVDDQINHKVGKLADFQDFTQHVIDQLIQSSTFTTRVTCLVMHHAEIAVAREAKFRDHNVNQEPHNDQITPPSPLTSCFEDSSKTFEDHKENEKEKSSSHSSKRSSSKKEYSSKGSLNDYKVDRHNKRSYGEEVLKPANNYFTSAKNFETYCLAH